MENQVETFTADFDSEENFRKINSHLDDCILNDLWDRREEFKKMIENELPEAPQYRYYQRIKITKYPPNPQHHD